ncbi:hypothetical protein [Candidatus Babela massiliensis]|uniref:Ankyrin repeats containing protein n=1 Tax=Candidatus Babela massiliensis TaxID=673862 RepID=V6DG78_9BACT|nr:hypothetical protein [Candidatus Babela massiliensis]CDK30602.1 hypothetical protein BABL1_gene_414 [Candidatus Babela massiliensis]
MLFSYKHIKFCIKMYTILFLFNLNLVAMTISVSLEENKSKILVQAISDNDVQTVKNILDSGILDIPRETLKESILLAAINGNCTIFELLENVVPRQTHRQAYEILKVRCPNFRTENS